MTTDSRIDRLPWGTGDDSQVWLVHFGSKSTPLIAQLLRELGVRTRILNHADDELTLAAADDSKLPKMVILSGGDQSVYDANAPTIRQGTFEQLRKNCFLLGICYGAQLLAKLSGGEVRRAKMGEAGLVQVRLSEDSASFSGYRGGRAIMNHGDEIERLPEGWQRVASTDDCQNAFVCSDRIWAVQFHPEMGHTENGRELLFGAIKRAGVSIDYRVDHAKFVETAASWMREQAPQGTVLCGLSGGVDSSVAFRIAELAFGERLHGIYVNTGWFREGETDEVRNVFGSRHVSYVDASEEFYEALDRVEYPVGLKPTEAEYRYYEAVRKCIGAKFIDVFVGHARGLGRPASALIQGTNAADIIESQTGLKSHHNVALPKQLGVNILEPLAGLYKSEIRALAHHLGLPDEIANRQPFPGPGLAIRTWGKLDRSYAPPLRQANLILEEVVRKHYPDQENRPCQYYVALVPLASTGLIGDERVIGYAWAVRMVWSEDRESYASLEVKALTQQVQDVLSKRLTSEVRMEDGTRFVRVFYELTGKPPSTTEPH
ncbi:hypothetical protein M0Q28_06640 [Patescibacteria group bacterium]|jgi:GMP synthase (glutamine-hydrolysing)|nr:hypothetical protein [Patescibacteria group bacterium]